MTRRFYGDRPVTAISKDALMLDSRLALANPAGCTDYPAHTG
ncbi:hypothetical protein [Crossiella sp. NPDC003009]